jgi:hypothetical protein
MDYQEFLQADILCVLHDYGDMTAETINSILGSDDDDVEFALYQLVMAEKIRELGKGKYTAVDEVNVKRLKKEHPNIF